MSRGAAVVNLVSFAVILYAHGIRHGKTLILASILGMGIYAVVPDAVWSRMVYSTEMRGNKMEARASLYDAALNRLPEYIVSGVGAGNFFQKWGLEKGFARHQGDGALIAQPSHNTLLQITINWGILGLGMFLLIVWCVYRSVPLHCGRVELSLALLGIMVAVGLVLLQTHLFYGKQLSFAVGMLVGSRRWIWPTGVASAVEVNQGPSPHRV
jgi:O-antigen ligase